jgi:CelD/BcsL family acetyltransferase involved in cellulose biosynthesis
MLRFEIVQDSEKIKELWNTLSPKETIYDDWEFRFCFHKYFQYPLVCHVGYEDDQLIGMLPLQLNTDKNYLEFFGGDYMEDNRVMIKAGYGKYIPEFYKRITEPAHLSLIRGEDQFTASLPIQDYKYVLSLAGYTNVDEYLEASFHGETRKTMKKKARRVEREGMELLENNFADIEKLFEYNRGMFGDGSSFNDRPHHTEIFHDLLQPHFIPQLLSFKVAGQLQGVSLALLYNKSYAYVTLGIAPNAIRDLSNFINLKNIERALALGAKEVDSFTGDYGWKERWHFSKIPQHKWEQ